VYVAQRDFEEAVSLAEKNRAFWENTTPGLINLHRDLKYTIYNFYCYFFSNQLDRFYVFCIL